MEIPNSIGTGNPYASPMDSENALDDTLAFLGLLMNVIEQYWTRKNPYSRGFAAWHGFC